ncbi:MAG: DUF1289 domain-containing protein [Methylophilaceae bacterium]
MASVASPCINVCQMNEATQLCLGCHRTVEEITRWWEMDAKEQRALLAVLEQREIEALNFG